MQTIAKSNEDFPHSIRKVKGVIHNKIAKEFPGIPDGIVQIGKDKWVMPATFIDWADTIYNFEARPDDVFICTYPRSGTTWTQEMIWLIANNLDYETARKTLLNERYPYMELHLLFKGNITEMMKAGAPPGAPQPASTGAPPSGMSTVNAIPNGVPTTTPVPAQPGDSSPLPPVDMMKMMEMLKPQYEALKAQTTRRFIKTHLPIKLMPRNVLESGAKIVYVARNPKDVAASYYNFHKVNPGFKFTGDFGSFLQYLMDDLLLYGPYWKHILDAWGHRNNPNVHFMFYEEAKLDMENTLRKLSAFLDNPISDEDLPKLMSHLQFENVKKNPSINFKFDPSKPKSQEFVRRGKVGGNPEITKDVAKKIEEWEKRSVGDSGLKFPFC